MSFVGRLSTLQSVHYYTLPTGTSGDVPHGRTPRVASAYVRQMADDELLIPGSNIQMMGTIGQGQLLLSYLLCIYHQHGYPT